MEGKDIEKQDLSLVILCYRAGESLREFVPKTLKTLENGGILNYEIILVGNYLKGVNDVTSSIVEELASHNNKIRFVAKEKKGMMGWDMKSGLELARGEYIAVIDGDGQVPVEDVVRVYWKIKNEKLDLVKTYRLKRGDSLWRKCISFFYNNIFHLLFPGLNSKDINAKPKIFTRESYEKLKLTSDDWFIDAEIMIQARRYKFRIREVPTVFLGLSGRRSFVKPAAIIEFIKNLIIYRIREFTNQKCIK